MRSTETCDLPKIKLKGGPETTWTIDSNSRELGENICSKLRSTVQSRPDNNINSIPENESKHRKQICRSSGVRFSTYRMTLGRGITNQKYETNPDLAVNFAAECVGLEFS